MIMLYINGMPVGCLTSVSRSEAISFIGTCKTSEDGAQTQLGRIYSYSIPFDGVMSTRNEIISWTGLKSLERIKINWEMVSDEMDSEAGEGFIENLELIGAVSDFITFTGTITGYD